MNRPHKRIRTAKAHAPKVTCIFCGGGESNEDIIALWLVRDAELDKEPIVTGFGQDTGETFDMVHEQSAIRKFLLRNVCKGCNNGWMSRLENKAKKALTPLLQKDLPDNDAKPLDSLKWAAKDLTLWLLKTAITFGAKMSVRVPMEMRQEVQNKILRPGIFVDLACSEFSGLYVTMSNQWNVVIDGQVKMRQLPDSFRLTWQVRHLVLRLSYFKFTERLQYKPRYPVVLHPNFRIPPFHEMQDESPIVKVIRRHVYPSVREFENETVYHESGSLDPVLEQSTERIIAPW